MMNPSEKRQRDEAQRYSHAEANRIRKQLAIGELDGWHYKKESVSQHQSIVVVYDEKWQFAGCWNQNSEGNWVW